MEIVKKKIYIIFVLLIIFFFLYFFYSASRLIDSATDRNTPKVSIVATKMHVTPAELFLFRNYDYHVDRKSRYPGKKILKIK